MPDIKSKKSSKVVPTKVESIKVEPSKVEPSKVETVENTMCSDINCINEQQKKITSLKEGIIDLDNILLTITKLCKDPNCAFPKSRDKPKTPVEVSVQPPKTSKDAAPEASKLENILSKIEEIVPPKKSITTDGEQYEDAVKEYNLDELDWKPIQKLCKDPICYSAYMGFRPPKSESSNGEHTHCGDESCVGNSGKICKSIMCPFHPDFGRKTDDIWKEKRKSTSTPRPSAPEGVSQPNTPRPSGQADEGVGLCGRASCPFASMEIDQILKDPNLDANIAAGGTACGNPACPFSKQTPVGLCGRASCPFASIENAMTPSAPEPPDNPCYPCETGTDGGLVPCPYAGQVKTYPCGSPSCPNVNPSGMIYTHYYANDYGFVQEAARPYCGSACPYDYMSSLGSKFPKPYAENYNTFNLKAPSETPSCPYLSKNIRESIASERRQVADNCNTKLCPFAPEEEDEGKDIDPCGSINCEANKPPRCSDKTCTFIEKFTFCDECGGIIPESFDEDFLDDVAEEESMSIISGAILKSDFNKEWFGKNKSSGMVVREDSKMKETVRRVSRTEAEVKVETALYQYPGVQIGHHDCGKRHRIIPANMGWAWNLRPPGNYELWRGYKPGAVSRTVYKMIKAHRKAYGIFDPNDLVKKKKSKSKFKMEDLRHCVELKKKNGDYTITVNPLKDPKTLQPYENPYMEVTPMQFKIEKEKKEVEPVYCPCDVVTPSISSASSEIDFHFSPPAAIPTTHQRKKKTLLEIDTQYNVNDLSPEFRPKKGKGKKGGKKGGKGKKKK